MPFQTEGMVIQNERIRSLYFLLGIYCPPIANQIKPGQFVMLRVSDDRAPLLRRPFSVYQSCPDHYPEKTKRGCLFILYKKVGKGTQKMMAWEKGQKVNLIGPLGNGFTLPPLSSSASIVLIGGGVGIASLHSLAEILRDRNLTVFMGGRTREDILSVNDFKKLTSAIFIATEDGSLGVKGTVVDLFLTHRKKFKGSSRPYLYTCGPSAMFQTLAKSVHTRYFICQASLETRMGCGFGACWGCVVKTNHPQTPYQRVCEEGPVFYLENILWE
jgi:dihydroorotate dehydrogenase electron transfer subunit